MIVVKSKAEIELMKKSGEIVAELFEKLSQLLKPGITTLELDRVAEEYIRSKNAYPSFKGYKGMPGAVDFPASICSSVNSQVVHGIPGLNGLNDGDIISIDLGVCLHGFHADAARTFPVGNVSEEAARLIRVTRESFYEGMKHAVAGNRLFDISHAIQTFVESNHFSVVRDFVGHGIGQHLHEDPQVPNYGKPGKGPRLEPGITLAVEPMVNAGRYHVKVLDNKWTVVTEDGSLSAHYENTIAITDGEPLILTKL